MIIRRGKQGSLHNTPTAGKYDYQLRNAKAQHHRQYSAQGEQGDGRIPVLLPINDPRERKRAEREEDLKNLIRDSFGPSIDDEEVCSLLLSSTYVAKCPYHPPALPTRVGSHAPSP